MEEIIQYPIEDGYTLEIENKGFIDCKIFGNKLIWDCYTVPKYRREGIFRILLNEVLTRFPDKEIYAAVTNKKIIPYIRSIGFIEIDEEIPYWGKTNCKNFKLIKDQTV